MFIFVHQRLLSFMTRPIASLIYYPLDGYSYIGSNISNKYNFYLMLDLREPRSTISYFIDRRSRLLVDRGLWLSAIVSTDQQTCGCQLSNRLSWHLYAVGSMCSEEPAYA
jgi:hypothetical protein